MKYNIVEMAGYVASLPHFTIGQFMRKYGLKYNDAAQLLETFEKAGIVGPFHGNKPREIWVKDINKAKQLITEYLNSIEVKDAEIFKSK